MKMFLISIGLIGPMILFGQNNLETSTKATTTTTQLTYHPEISSDSSYQVIKNLSGEVISKDVLERINYFRRKEDFLWKVDEEIEILIFGLEE